MCIYVCMLKQKCVIKCIFGSRFKNPVLGWTLVHQECAPCVSAALVHVGTPYQLGTPPEQAHAALTVGRGLGRTVNPTVPPHRATTQLKKERGGLERSRAVGDVLGLSVAHLRCDVPGDSRTDDAVSDRLVVGMHPDE